MTLVRRVALAFAVMLLAIPANVSACPVCQDPRENGGAFLVGTIFLSLLPLAMIGGLLAWLHGRARAVENENEAGASPAGPSDPARLRVGA